MLDDIVKTITELIWGESMLEMGFIKFFFTFVAIFVAVKFYMWLVDGDDDDRRN